jgi:hypothetical protein
MFRKVRRLCGAGELESSETKNITSTVNDLAFPKYINVIQIIPPLN